MASRLVTSHVHHQRPVGQFDDLAFIAAGADGWGFSPALAPVIGVDHVRGVRVVLVLAIRVVGRADEAAFVLASLQLDGYARSGGVPAPVGVAACLRQIDRL